MHVLLFLLCFIYNLFSCLLLLYQKHCFSRRSFPALVHQAHHITSLHCNIIGMDVEYWLEANYQHIKNIRCVTEYSPWNTFCVNKLLTSLRKIKDWLDDSISYKTDIFFCCFEVFFMRKRNKPPPLRLMYLPTFVSPTFTKLVTNSLPYISLVQTDNITHLSSWSEGQHARDVDKIMWN